MGASRMGEGSSAPNREMRVSICDMSVRTRGASAAAQKRGDFRASLFRPRQRNGYSHKPSAIASCAPELQTGERPQPAGLAPELIFDVRSFSSWVLRCWLMGAITAVGGECSAGDPARLIAGKEYCQSSNVFRLAEAAHGMRSHSLLTCVIIQVEGRHHLRFHNPRTDAVDTDIVFSMVQGHGSRHGQNGTFGSSVSNAVARAQRTQH